MIITRRPLLLGAAAAGLLAGKAFAQTAADFMGEWHGALNMGSQTLRLRLVVAEGSTSTLYSVVQGNSAIPVGTTTITGARITLDIPVIRASFTGQLRDGRIEGQFTQGGTLPLVFQRGEAIAGATEALTEARLEALRAGINTPAMAAAATKAGGRSMRPSPIATLDMARYLLTRSEGTIGELAHLLVAAAVVSVFAFALSAGAPLFKALGHWNLAIFLFGGVTLFCWPACQSVSASDWPRWPIWASPPPCR